MGCAPVISAGGNNWSDSTTGQPSTGSIAVICTIGDQSSRATSKPSHWNALQRRCKEFHLRWGSRRHVNSERSTLAIDQYHKLCSLAPLGFTDALAPFFAEAKVPSTKHSFH
jgi:hypothetical protein